MLVIVKLLPRSMQANLQIDPEIRIVAPKKYERTTMISDTISADLTRAFTMAVETIEDKNLKESRQRITAVTLLDRQSGLCALSEQDVPKSGWRVITQEDLAQLLQGEENAAYQTVIKRVATAMATCPRLRALDCPLTNSALAPFVERFWKMGHNNAKLDGARVVLVLAAQNHPELELPEEIVTFYVEDRPAHYRQNVRIVTDFINDVHNALVALGTKRKVLEPIPMDKVGGLSDTDLLLKLFFFNVNEDLQVRNYNRALHALKRHENKEITHLPEPIRKELAKRVTRPGFVEEAKETLAPLPHGHYFLEVVQDIAAAQNLSKLDIG